MAYQSLSWYTLMLLIIYQYMYNSVHLLASQRVLGDILCYINFCAFIDLYRGIIFLNESEDDFLKLLKNYSNFSLDEVYI